MRFCLRDIEENFYFNNLTPDTQYTLFAIATSDDSSKYADFGDIYVQEFKTIDNTNYAEEGNILLFNL